MTWAASNPGRGKNCWDSSEIKALRGLRPRGLRDVRNHRPGSPGGKCGFLPFWIGLDFKRCPEAVLHTPKDYLDQHQLERSISQLSAIGSCILRSLRSGPSRKNLSPLRRMSYEHHGSQKVPLPSWPWGTPFWSARVESSQGKRSASPAAGWGGLPHFLRRMDGAGKLYRPAGKPLRAGPIEGLGPGAWSIRLELSLDASVDPSTRRERSWRESFPSPRSWPERRE